MTIGIHVLGPGYGESIVLELPDGQCGVIDTFAGRAKNPPPVLQFLERGLNTRRLLFLAVTHPHADHCLGCRRLIETLTVDEFWVFDALHFEGLHRYFRELSRLGRRELVEEDLRLPSGRIGSELIWVNRRLVAVEKKRTGLLRLLRSGRPFQICQGAISVHFLTPGDGQLHGYRAVLGADMEALVGDGPHTASVNHNLASGAILFQYGKTRLLLMADAEEPLWAEWLTEMGEATHPDLDPVHLVKVAHHGSRNGYHGPAYDRLGGSGRAVAVMTPFDRHRYPLPTAEGLECVRPRVGEVFCTNRTAGATSSLLTWHAVPAAPPATLPTVPPRWIRDCQRRPELLTLLAPASAAAAPDPALTLPPGWVADLSGDPRLVNLLHPAVRDRHVTADREGAFDRFRVSFFFDDQGQELVDRRYVGAGAGQLTVAPADG
jgi:beta-lactamase superfamily II metal-dependent hydrolase